MHRHAAHGDVVAQMLAPLGQRDVEGSGRLHRILEEQLVKITHAVEQQIIRMRRLDLQILRHHGRGGIEYERVAPVQVAILLLSFGHIGFRHGQTYQINLKQGQIRAYALPHLSPPSPPPVDPAGQSAQSRPKTGTIMADRPSFTAQEALNFHAGDKPGKLEIRATKPMATQRDLSLAYSPGVAVPVLAIAQNPDVAYVYTTRANRVAVISNGTAILGLGDLGALASKPVMEGKAVLFKRFADIDAIDLEVDTRDVESFIGAVRYLGPTFGGINLEDIKAPDCFIIEQRLRELMDIPVFHDDQHGTAIITAAGLINALQLTGRKIENTKVVVNGAGAAGIAVLDLMVAMGVMRSNVVLCDTKGVIYAGRAEGMNRWKAPYAAETNARTLSEALEGADVFVGLSAKGAVTPDMVKTMAKEPIIFAMANPDPEITPEEVRAVRNDAIIATGRSDYPNQINNVLGFPYIFRGALDVAARTINEEMKIAAAQALADLAREEVPREVAAAYRGVQYVYGREYLIPVPFDPRLISRVSSAVAEAAIKSGVARRPIQDMDAYRRRLSGRLG